MAFSGGEYLVTGTATSLAAALGITEVAKKHCSKVLLRNNPAAANDAFWGPSTVTTTANRAGVLKAADSDPAYLDGLSGWTINLDEIFLVGTAAAGNIIHITLIR